MSHRRGAGRRRWASAVLAVVVAVAGLTLVPTAPPAGAEIVCSAKGSVSGAWSFPFTTFFEVVVEPPPVGTGIVYRVNGVEGKLDFHLQTIDLGPPIGSSTSLTVSESNNADHYWGGSPGDVGGTWDVRTDGTYARVVATLPYAYAGTALGVDITFSCAEAPVDPVKPSAPAAPVAVAGPGQVTLTWTPPADGGAPITGYRITPYKDGVAQTPIDVGALTSKVITGLVNGATYRFTVAARNSVGLGAASPKSNAVVPATVPGAPLDVVATAGNKRAIVTWKPPASDGGSAITGYKLRMSANGNPLQTFTLGNVVTSTILDLTPGTIYTFEVAATNAIGTGPFSVVSNAMTPPPLAFASWSGMVDRQFRDLVGRPPTAAEVATWIKDLQPGAKAAGTLPAALRTSADHKGNVDPVTRLYSAYLGRTPDKGGLTYWIGRKRGGTTLASISSSFAGSNEFVSTYGTLTNRQFVELVYQNVLGRPGEASGVTYWTKQLDTGARTRGQVMVGFSDSSEYIRTQAPRVTVIVFYVLMLGRTPTAPELAAEIATLTGGGTAAQLAQRILDSAAYAARIAGL